MNKAFTKEDDAPDDEVADFVVLPAGVKNYVTPEGATEFRRQLEEDRAHLIELRRRAESEQLRDVRMLEKKIARWTQRLETFEIVEAPATREKITFGATVVVRDENDVEKRYQIVGVDEVDLAQGKVSWMSPLSKALIGAKEGDEVSLVSPRGEQSLEIIAIES